MGFFVEAKSFEFSVEAGVSIVTIFERSKVVLCSVVLWKVICVVAIGYSGGCVLGGGYEGVCEILQG